MLDLSHVWLFLLLLRNLVVIWLNLLFSGSIVDLLFVLLRHWLLILFWLSIIHGWCGCVVHVVQVRVLLHLVRLEWWQSHSCVWLPACELSVLHLKLLNLHLQLVDLVGLHPHLLLSLALLACVLRRIIPTPLVPLEHLNILL